MTQKELIRQEIERRKKKRMNEDLPISIGRYYEDRDLLSFIDSLPECEETAKIPSEKYEEEINNEIQGFIDEYGYERGEDKILIAIVARHFAEWQKEQDARDMYMSDNRHFQKIYELGKKDMKEQMMKEAVEAEIGYWNQRGLSIRLDQSLEKLGYDEDTEVKVIIVKQNDKPRD